MITYVFLSLFPFCSSLLFSSLLFWLSGLIWFRFGLGSLLVLMGWWGGGGGGAGEWEFGEEVRNGECRGAGYVKRSSRG